MEENLREKNMSKNSHEKHSKNILYPSKMVSTD